MAEQDSTRKAAGGDGATQHAEDAADRASQRAGGDIAEQAGHRASEMADRASERIRSAGDRAGEMGNTAQGMVDRAKDTAVDMKDDVMERAEELMPKARETAYDAVESGRESAAGVLDRAADRIGEYGGGEGVQAMAAERAVAGIEGAAGYLHEHETAEIWSDVETYVKAHPGRSVLGAIAAGFIVGRMLR